MTAGACAAPCGEGGGGESGDDNDFTGGAGGASQASRRGVAGAPSQSSTKGNRHHKGQQFSGEVVWGNTGCGKNLTGVGKM